MAKQLQLTLGPGLPLTNEKGITIKELKELINSLPEVNPKTGEEYEVWMFTEDRNSSPVKSICQLNKGDLIFDKQI